MGQMTSTETGGAGLASWAARAALTVVWLSVIAQSILNGERIESFWLGAIAYASALLAAFAITNNRQGPLGHRELALLIGASALVVMIILSTISTAHEDWLLNFIGYLLALSIPRGHPLAGGLSLAALVLGVTAWAVATGQTAAALLSMLVIPVLAALVGYVWRAVLRDVVHRERRARSANERAQLQVEAVTLAELEFSATMAAIAKESAPIFRDIIAGKEVDQALLRRISVAEAGIRDRIRSADLQNATLTVAIQDARMRGVTVVVLGSGDQVESLIGSELSTAIVEVIGRPDLHSVTVRTLPVGRDAAVTIVAELDTDERFRIRLDHVGNPVVVNHDMQHTDDGSHERGNTP